MDEFDNIVGRLQEDKQGRIGLVFMFDKLPGSTMFDIDELVKNTYLANRYSRSMANLTVTAVIDETADEIEALIQKSVDD